MTAQLTRPWTGGVVTPLHQSAHTGTALINKLIKLVEPTKMVTLFSVMKWLSFCGEITLGV